nr:LysM domain-containing protein [Bacillus velezensis]
MKKGDTYWGCARKYGTTVSALRRLNPWPDRRIPIGVKMRIK